MSDFTIYRNGNCTNTTDAEAEDQMYISVDLEYLRDSNSEYCQETVMCGENYISLRQVFKLKIFNFKRFFFNFKLTSDLILIALRICTNALNELYQNLISQFW